MRAWLLRAEEVLRGELWTTRPGALAPLVALAVFCATAYGAMMGTFGGLTGERAFQVLGSALKVPLLLVVTALLSLPSFFVVNTLVGLRDDFREVLRALAASQAGLAIVLLSLAPVTLLWYASSGDYRQAILFNGLIFATASGGAQVVLQRAYARLIARDRKHRGLLRLWLGLYVFVGTEMAWVLRPFIGNPDQPVELFRADSLGNAYVEVGRMIWEQVAR